MSRLYKQMVVQNLSNRDIIFKNFRGEARQYNEAGRRNFCLCLDDPKAIYKYGVPEREDVFNVGDPAQLAEFIGILQADGFNLKSTPERDGYPSRPYMKVNLAFDKGTPPAIYMLNSLNRPIPVGVEFMEKLDGNLIEKADIHFTPYNYDENGNAQSAWLRTMYFQLANTDPFANLYPREIDTGDEVPEMPFN